MVLGHDEYVGKYYKVIGPLFLLRSEVWWAGWSLQRGGRHVRFLN